MEQDILYTVIIYRDKKRVKILDINNNLIIDNNYNTDTDMYNVIVSTTRSCNNVDQINIIYK